MKKKVLIWATGILLGIFVFAVGTVVTIELIGNAAIAREKAKLKALHKPTSFSEIAPLKIPDSENAAVELSEVFDLFEKNSDNLILDPLENPSTDKIKKIVKDRFSLEVLTLAQKACKKTGFRWDLKYSDGDSMLIPHLSGFRNLVRLLCLRGMFEAKTGKLHQAYKSYLTALKISSFLKTPPLLINNLVQYACDNITIKCMSNTLQKYGISNEDAEMLLNEINRRNYLKWTQQAMDGELVFSMDALDETIARGFVGRFDRANSEDASLLLKLDYATFLRVSVESEKWYSMPFWEIPGAPDVKEMDKNLFSGIPRYYTVTRGFTYFSICRKKAAEMERNIAKLKLTFLIYIYNNNHSHFPEKLSELNSEETRGLLVDAVTGKKFIYRLTDNVVDIY